MAKRIKNHNGGNTYTCNGKAYMKSSLEASYKSICHSGINRTNLNSLRRDAKKAPALIFSKLKILKHIDKDVSDILINKGSNEQSKAYIECMIETFNNPQNDIGLEFHYKSNELDKKIQCAYIDSKYVINRYLSKTLTLLSKEPQLNRNFIQDYKNAKEAITIFINYLRTLYKNFLPNLISVEHYNKCVDIDSNISKFYVRQNDYYYKRSKNTNVRYAALNIKGATVIITEYENLLKGI